MRLTSRALERCGVPPDIARANLPFIRAAMREFDITTPRRARMFLAQVLHESMRLTRFEEIDSGERYEGNKTLGNTQPGDGVRFKGRGPIQITGRWNYTHFGAMLKLDLVRHPEWAAEPRHGWRLAAAYFEDRGCNRAADRGDFREVTRLINSGLLHLEEREKYYDLLAKVAVLPGRSHRHRAYTREEVLVMTNRLSLARAEGTGKPYLVGTRTRFGAKVKRALRAFQADHGLVVDGQYGPKTMQALARAAKRAKRGHALDDQDAGTTLPKIGVPHASGETRPPKFAARTQRPVRSKLPNLVAEIKRLDVETNRAWKKIVAEGSGRRQLLAQANEGGQIGAILHRIEQKLDRLMAPKDAPAGKAKPDPSGQKGNEADQGQTARESRRDKLEDLSDAELGERIERLEQTIFRYRAALISRYARAEALVDREVKK